MLHLYFECNVFKSIWNSLQKWCEKAIKQSIDITLLNILFLDYEGVAKEFINTCILIIEQRICAHRCKKEKPSFMKMFTSVAEYCKVEKRIAYKKNKGKKFEKKWKYLLP